LTDSVSGVGFAQPFFWCDILLATSQKRVDFTYFPN
jgi:hypothetical protein